MACSFTCAKITGVGLWWHVMKMICHCRCWILTQNNSKIQIIVQLCYECRGLLFGKSSGRADACAAWPLFRGMLASSSLSLWHVHPCMVSPAHNLNFRPRLDKEKSPIFTFFSCGLYIVLDFSLYSWRLYTAWPTSLSALVLWWSWSRANCLCIFMKSLIELTGLLLTKLTSLENDCIYVAFTATTLISGL